ncbi:hypothetical protein DFP73DRAFT_528606 [Morchella snyderi]|nr:hypothetical protein DFP73DRAFT_528606 [Morchella snyderi]
MEASALLTRRIHHQKQLISKAKAEARRNSAISLVSPNQCTNDGAPRTPENKSPDPTSSQLYSLSTPEYRSIGRSNGSVDSDIIRFGSMGMREQTEIISQKSKENFGLKLMLTKTREQALRCEKELRNMRHKLDRVQARNEILERENAELKQTIEGRDVILDAAAKEIAECQDQLSGFRERESAQKGRQELSDMDNANFNSDTTLVSRGAPSFGISPYASRDSLESCYTPIYKDEETNYSPCTSSALNTIDFNTPCSGRSSSLSRDSPLPGLTPICPSRSDFLDRCASAMGESPGPKNSPLGSSHESLPSLISESSLSMYGGRGNNEGETDADIFYDHRPGHHNENGEDRLNIKRWGRHGQSNVNELTKTPTRNPSTTRRSPRAELREFRDKQDKQDKQQSQDTMRHMPPTPESMSPRRRIGGSPDSISSDDSNEADGGLGLTPSIEDVDDSKTETLENNRGSRKSVRTIQRSGVVPSPLQKSVREIADRLRSPFKFPSSGSVAQKEPQTFGDITHLRETKKRLGYGFGSKLGNIAAPSKQPGRDISGHSRKLTVSKNSKDKLVTVPVKPVTTNLPVRSRIRLSSQQPGQGLETPPYTPNNDSATSHDSEKTTLVPRSLMKKLSWESLNSGSNSNSSDGVPRPAYNSHYTIGGSPSYLRRNSTASLATTDMSAMTLKTVKDIRRMSAIPALVRAGSVKEKSRHHE